MATLELVAGGLPGDGCDGARVAGAGAAEGAYERGLVRGLESGWEAAGDRRHGGRGAAVGRGDRAGGQGPVGYYSSRLIEDGSYLRLKTVSLSYRLPSVVDKLIGASGIDISLSAQNLYTWTKYSGMDPEVSVRNSALTPGFDYSAYPRSRSLVFGIKATF